jgi:peptidoglycan-associated lipoprotein
MKDINFNFDSADLSQSARAILKENADWLKGNPAVRVQIEGHCDERGAADYNMALGAKRAQAAMDYLATLGVAANRLSTISYGEEIPVCREHTEDCWAKNRRARFVAAQTKPTSSPSNRIFQWLMKACAAVARAFFYAASGRACIK